MRRHVIRVTLGLLIITLSACQLDAETGWLLSFAPTDTPMPTATNTPTVAPTPTNTPTPTITPTPTNTPSPTATPIPSDRLVIARQAYASGDYQTARTEFDNLLADPGADDHEKRLALHWRGRSELELGDTQAAIATLKMFLQQYPSDELARAAQFNLGRAYEESGQPNQAASTYLGAIIPNDPANVYIYKRIGDMRLRTGAYTETVTAYRAGIEATDDVSFQVHLREGIAQAELLLNQNPAGAITQYRDILQIAKIDSYRAKILRLLGETYVAAGDTEIGYQTYLEAVNNYPEAYDSYLALVELVNANVPVDDFQRGLVDYHARAYQPAVAAFESYLAQNNPADASTKPISATATISATALLTPTVQPTPLPRAAEATWFIGLSWKALGQYNRAISTFQKLIDNFPDSPNWGQAHVEIGLTLISQGNHARAKTTLREFAASRPNHPLAAEALWRAARLDMSDKMFDDAHTHLHVVAQKYPTSQYAAEALYWAGQASYQLQDYQGAIDDWAELAEKYPTSELVSFGGYWRARALLELGRQAEAETVLSQVAERPEDYYVLRARDLLTGQMPHPVPIILPDEAQLAEEKAQAEAWLKQWLGPAREAENLSAIGSQLQNDPAFQRGHALLALGLREQALVEFEIVKDNWWHDPLAMYRLSNYFSQNNIGRLTIITAARLIFLSPAKSAEDAPIYIQRLYYPFFFADVIFREAEQHQIDPALVAALIRQESLFEPSAESIAGARGLMQVMPTTGEYVAERSNFEDFNTDLLWRPFISIKMGSWYINQQLGIFEDNQFAALAAYNAGPGHVLEWVKTSDDLDVFVESIPFWESRTYIRRIYVNLSAYRRIYGAPSATQP